MNNNYGYKSVYKPQPIPKSCFPHIEKALGIKLNNSQKYALFNGVLPNWSDRRSGRTTAHCIQVALSIGKPINTPSKVADFGNGTQTYRDYNFLLIYRDIAQKLYDYGFNTRRVGLIGGWHGFKY